MSRFTGPLVIEELEPGRRWRLREPILYEAGAEGSGHWVEVPAGFETDGATLPAVLRTVLAVWGTYGRAACLHDYLYWLLRERIVPAGQEIWPAEIATTSARRRWADGEFYLAMRACGTRPTFAWLIWAAVRCGGGRHISRGRP